MADNEGLSGVCDEDADSPDRHSRIAQLLSAPQVAVKVSHDLTTGSAVGRQRQPDPPPARPRAVASVHRHLPHTRWARKMPDHRSDGLSASDPHS